MSDLVYVHNKETGEVSRKAFGDVNINVEDWYAYEADAIHAVRVSGVSDTPDDAQYYFHSEDASERPVRGENPPT